MRHDFAGVLSQLRREKKMSQRKVAEDLNISQALLSHYEKGVREPRLDFVIRLCEYYGVTADYILGRTVPDESDGMMCDDVQSFFDAAASLFSRIDSIGNAELSQTCARYLSEAVSLMSRALDSPYAMNEPRYQAALFLLESEFLDALRKSATEN